MEVFLETDRLILRRFTDADADSLVSLDGDEHGDVEYAVTREEWEQDRLPEAAPAGR